MDRCVHLLEGFRGQSAILIRSPHIAAAVLREVAVLTRGSKSLTGLIAGDRILIAAQLVTVVAGFFAVALVGRIVRGQRGRAPALGLS